MITLFYSFNRPMPEARYFLYDSTFLELPKGMSMVQVSYTLKPEMSSNTLEIKMFKGASVMKSTVPFRHFGNLEKELLNAGAIRANNKDSF